MEKVNKDIVTVVSGNKTVEIPTDTIIISVGYKPINDLYDSLHASNKIVFNACDSREVHNIMHAIWDAFEVARSI